MRARQWIPAFAGMTPSNPVAEGASRCAPADFQSPRYRQGRQTGYRVSASSNIRMTSQKPACTAARSPGGRSRVAAASSRMAQAR